jgi:hypothetical protein
VSEGRWKDGLEDEPKHNGGKVTNSTKKCLVEGHSGILEPYVLDLVIQSCEVRPNHEGEAGEGDVSGVYVVLYILVECRGQL